MNRVLRTEFGDKLARLIIVLNTLFVLFAPQFAARAQEYLDDVSAGKLTLDSANHNYFVASQSEQLKGLFTDIERYHLITCPHNSGGVMGDLREGRPDLALRDLQYLLERIVNHPTGLQVLGLIAKQKNNPSLPLPYYEKALRLYPRYALTHAQYGAYLVSIDRVAEGIAKLQDATRIDGKLVQAYVWLARAYAKTGNSELARQAAEQAKELGFTGQTMEGTGGSEKPPGK